MSCSFCGPKSVQFFLVVLVTLIVGKGYAQVDNSLLESPVTLDSSQKLGIEIPVTGFVKNNEYFNQLSEGYTLWGVQVNPALVYRVSDKVLLRSGIFWRNDFGENKLNKPQFTFTLKYSDKSWNYLFGTIEGNLNHRLVEPLYNFERYLLTPVENGLQINHRGKKHFFDFWITYPQNTLPGYTRQEHFWGGLSNSLRILEKDKFKIDWITQATVFHAGGQSISAGLPVKTVLHTALGVSGKWKFSGWVKRISIEPYWLYFSESSATKGNAVHLNATVDTKALKVMISYWNGHRFDSEYGGDLFVSSSRNTLHPEAYQVNREWLMLRLIKEIDLGGGLRFSGRFEPYFNFATQEVEHSEGIYLTYTLREKLLPIRK